MSAPMKQDTIFVQTVVDVPGITEEERRELGASLEEARAQIERGEYVTFEDGMFERRLARRRASRRQRAGGSEG